MKICAIICEYNPFHNGHAYLIAQAKERSDADAVLCLMSGNFVQRGEASILEKHIRARHAIFGGADAVIELPTCFATSSAEIFAKGAIKILSSIPEVRVLCFGTESAEKEELLSAAKLLTNEPKEVSEKIQDLLSKGVSYAKARAQAWSGLLPIDLLSSPNNILAIEYTKAIFSGNSSIDILPVKRIGDGYLNEKSKSEYPSATAIRKAIQQGISIHGIPEFVSSDLPTAIENVLQTVEAYALLNKSASEIENTPDCSEGLENALKNAVRQGERNIAEKLTSARYTTSRLRRILLQNALNITKSDIRDYLNADLYLKVLAINKNREDLLSSLGNAASPLLIRAHDEDKLCCEAKRCLKTDIFAEQLYSLLYPSEKKTNTIFIEK
ncbi:MAG: nucleotidyltransferase family protein [Clostridia bacterium]|nr:nucleotidyltransferase family protein [Clostridia bacterium]